MIDLQPFSQILHDFSIAVGASANGKIPVTSGGALTLVDTPIGLSSIPNSTILGNVSGSSAIPVALTSSQARTAIQLSSVDSPTFAGQVLTPSANGQSVLRINQADGTRSVSIGTYPGVSTIPAIWLGSATPSGSDYILARENTTTLLNAPTGPISFRINNLIKGTIDASGFLEVTGGIITPVALIGGTGGPRIKNNSGTVAFRNNADSADTPISASNITASGNVIVQGTGTLSVASSGATAPANTQIYSRSTGSSTNTWKGRIVAGGDNVAFLMGEYNSQAWLGAHNAALNTWNILKINPDGNQELHLGNTSGIGGPGLYPIITVINNTGDVTINRNGGTGGNLTVGNNITAAKLNTGTTVDTKKIAVYANADFSSFYGFGVSAGRTLAYANDTLVMSIVSGSPNRVLINTGSDDGSNALQVAGSITASGDLTVGAASSGPELNLNVSWVRLKAQADGVMSVWSSSRTDFNRLQLGGTTSSYPAIKRSGTTVAIRLADDSADAPVTASNITASGTVTISGTGGTGPLSNSLVTEIITDTVNTGEVAARIYPSRTSTRLFFGKTGNKFYSLNLANVIAVEGMPAHETADYMFWGYASGVSHNIGRSSDNVVYSSSGPSGGAHVWRVGTSYASFTEGMRLTSAGNLLIGTTTDDGSNKLQVNGTVRATQFTQDAAGTLLWSGRTALISPEAGCLQFYTSVGGNAVKLIGDANHILAQRDGTNAQAFRIYGSYTSGSVYDRLTISADSTNAYFSAETNAGGMGIIMGTTGSSFFQIRSNGVRLRNEADNAFQYIECGDVYSSGGLYGNFVVMGTGDISIRASGGIARIVAANDSAYADLLAKSATFTGAVYQSWTSGVTDPTTGSLADGRIVAHKRTDLGEVRFWCNDGGVIKKLANFA